MGFFDLFKATENRELRNRIDSISEELQSAKTEIQQMKSQIEVYRRMLDERHKTIKDYEDMLTPSVREYITTEQGIEEKKQQLDDLHQQLDHLQHDHEEKDSAYQKLLKTIASAQRKLDKLRTLQKSIQYSAEHYFSAPPFEHSVLDPTYFSEIDQLLEPTVQLHLHSMDVKDLRKRFNQNKKVIEEVLHSYEGRYTTKANATIYQLMGIALEAELQNILYNIGYGKLDTSLDNVKAITAKYMKIAADANKQIIPTISKFIGEIEYLYLEAVKIEYEYYVQKERIKEEQRALREQMREEAAERKILQQQQKQIENEEQKYQKEISNISAQLTSSDVDDDKTAELEARLKELEAQLAAVNNKKEEIIKLQHGKAGHVYIISNLGAFGDHMFKIGMTRRQDPQERIDELGSASVPFPFDVHSTIFSDDAPALENSIHKRLNDRRVNKVNLRKEFFDVSVEELEQLVNELQPTAEFTKTMLAEQYHQSLSMDAVYDLVDYNDDDDDEDDA